MSLDAGGVSTVLDQASVPVTLVGITRTIASLSLSKTTLAIAGAIDEQRAATQEIARSVNFAAQGTQEVARAYGALKTPDVFVLGADLRLAYRGAPDADYDDPSQNASWLREALDAVLDRLQGRSEGRPVQEEETRADGPRPQDGGRVLAQHGGHVEP